MEVSGHLYAPGLFIPGKRVPNTNLIGGWVEPRTVLDAVEKNLFPLSGVEPRRGQPTDEENQLRNEFNNYLVV
jgi:hypothetical protein